MFNENTNLSNRILGENSMNKIFIRSQSRQRGAAMIPGMFRVGALLYSAVIPSILGYQIATGNVIQDMGDVRYFVPGPLIGGLASLVDETPSDAGFTAGFFFAFEAVSFGIGYGIGCLSALS
ncbi:hypothetical protein CMI45_01045 [Candidatus Pacearchaeota archaeon]|nr:hypothetical protein [Candidatus Pacearchaeota archaeon]|tara:strand:+ start:1418 stop:1783 length:366 start_codon:yes stop_codon:yes gene_type:complete